MADEDRTPITVGDLRNLHKHLEAAALRRVATGENSGKQSERSSEGAAGKMAWDLAQAIKYALEQREK